MIRPLIDKAVILLKINYRTLNKVFLFILCLSIIVMLYPKSVKFKYEFHKGKPWLHNDLIAPFDFPIYKTEEDIENETNELLKNFYPYYIFSDSITEVVKNKYIQIVEQESANNSTFMNEDNKKVYLSTGDKILSEILSTGIIKINNFQDSTKKNDAGLIYILNNNIASKRDISSFLTIKQASERIDNLLSNVDNSERIFLLPILQNVLTHNVFYDENLTAKNKEILLQQISQTRGLVQNGEKIVSKGELISVEKFIIIESLKKEYENLLGTSQRYYMIIVGQILIVALLLVVLFLFILNFRKKIYDNNKKLLFIVLQVILMVIITRLIVSYNISLLYAVPVCITPIIIRAFFDTRLAIFVHVITVVFISNFAPNSYEFVIYHLITGIVAVLSIINMHKRSQLFYTAFYIFTTYLLLYVGFNLVFEGSLQSIDTALFLQFGVSAILNLLAFPLIFLYEKVFGYPTDYSLLELTNTNNPLLRELASKAPGTFQHSLQVAALAEEASYQIGGNPLLVRAGALYHDIGKCLFPYYFIENQKQGLNPHNDLSYEESAKIIISHVIKGIELAKKHKLPEYIIDFIRTHQGTKKTDFFYKMSLQENPGLRINVENFTYRGPLPFSKETTVLMMADAVEAASRSLKTYTEESIDELVERIIENQITEKQFIKSEITFKEISDIKKIFKKHLHNVYHVRIEYPL